MALERTLPIAVFGALPITGTVEIPEASYCYAIHREFQYLGQLWHS